MAPFIPVIPAGPYGGGGGGGAIGGLLALVVSPFVVGALVALVAYIAGFLVDAAARDTAGRSSRGGEDHDVLFAMIAATAIAAGVSGAGAAVVAFLITATAGSWLGFRAGNRRWARAFARVGFRVGAIGWVVVGLGFIAWAIYRGIAG